ncbi:hypothetical protein AB1Y20_018566 [Prymnesium parvum]|uniref:Bestrophin homolog n=1 Tax=Prymnesium parvum TaxID=97485 RepID=A0AB34JSM6_PRYPA
MEDGPAHEEEEQVRLRSLYYIRRALADIQTSSGTPEALDDAMPGVLERKSLLTMTHLWDKRSWKRHRSLGRWWLFVRNWPSSSILKSIRPLINVLLLFTLLIIAVNRLAEHAGLGRPLQLPLAPLSLQAASIGLLVVFRNNQTHDRLKEAQRALGGLGPLGREIMQLLIVHVPPARARDVGHAARLLALYGWALKMQCRGEEQSLAPIAAILLPRAHGWLLQRENRPAAVLLRLRAVLGALRAHGALNSDAFKFIEERLAKLSAVDATCNRLATFPVPPSYHRHGSRALILWLGSLPFVMEGLNCHILQSLVSVACTAFLLLGIDHIAIEIEQPLDVLPLHVFAANMSTDVAAVLESWWLMPALPKWDEIEVQLGDESFKSQPQGDELLQEKGDEPPKEKAS